MGTKADELRRRVAARNVGGTDTKRQEGEKKTCISEELCIRPVVIIPKIENIKY